MYKLRKIAALCLLSIFMISYGGVSYAYADETEKVDISELQSETLTYASSSEANVVDVKNATDAERTLKMENLPKIKNVSSNLVTVTNHRVIVPKGDVFKVAFAQDFTTKNLQVGQKVEFVLPKGLYTQEGRMLLPCGTQILASVRSYTPPKWFNRNARVMLDFQEILVPNSAACSVGACVYGKYNALQRSGWATFAKPAIWTVGLFGVGAGLGAAIGAASSHAAIGCLAVGMPIGGGVGLILGVVTPGLHYTAKAGKQIPIMLTSDMVFYNTSN